jgi:glycerol-3-phosphate dehydrogenase
MGDAGPEEHREVPVTWDLLVVGGGIHGIALALEASRRGLSTLLVERGEIGAATSANSLRIVHGGLRYLQRLDLPRFRTSVAERSWFLRSFPDLVHPLPCLLPLYSPPRGGALRRAAVLRLALAADGLLGRRRNEGLPSDRALPPGRILDARETAQLAPALDRRGLVGGTLWHDAFLVDPAGLFREMLRWAGACGAQVLEGVTAERLLTADGRAVGIVARDLRIGAEFTLRASRVANCAGPWGREVARAFDRDLPGLFTPALAFNLILDRPPTAEAALAPLYAEVALAVAAPGRAKRTSFVVPCAGRILAGTCHRPGPAPGGPTEEEIQGFLGELSAALPGLALRRAEVLAVLWGLLPAVRPGVAEPADRPVIHDHGARGGPRGLVSVSGVKLTTARAVAERALATLYGRPLPALTEAGRQRPPAPQPRPRAELARLATPAC